MILGVIPSLGESIEILTRVGVAPRFINAYLGRYSREFEKTYYFTNANEEPAFPPRVYAVPKETALHYALYAMLLPFIQRRPVKECDCFRVMQLIGAVPALIIKLIYRKPYVATYGFKYTEFARIDQPFWIVWATAIIEFLGLRMADGIIVTTPELREYVGRYIRKEKIHFIPNGVDTGIFTPLPGMKGTGDRKRILYVGRLVKQKNLFSLIEAVSMLPQQYSLLFVGEGNLEKELKKYAEEKKVDLEIRPGMANDELPRFINQAVMFILPSLVEGHPKVLLEAMSCGIPCIGTDVPGIRDLIQDEVTGILCSDTTSESIARGIKRIMENRKLAETIGSNARQFIQENYELNRLLDKEIELLRAVATKYSD
jgi:glycosyltransferase involved in cell wall biosynthesis